jgi:hypothetical protein
MAACLICEGSRGELELGLTNANDSKVLSPK